MSRLSDLLPEPPDGTTIVLTGATICGHMVVRRDDERAKSGALADGQRWFFLDDSRADPHTWREVTTYAQTAYALGPVLASTETDSQDGAESQPGTYWERAVLERFAAGGPVDLKTMRRQVAALLVAIPAETHAGEEDEADA